MAALIFALITQDLGDGNDRNSYVLRDVLHGDSHGREGYHLLPHRHIVDVGASVPHADCTITGHALAPAATHKFSSGLRLQNFRRGDGLADVTLGVVGNMHQQACNRRRQSPLAYGAALLQRSNVKRSHPAYTAQ